MELRSVVQRLRRVVYLVAYVALFASMFTHLALVNTYGSYPRAPDPETSRTVPYVPRHTVVYITRGQSDFLGWVRWIEIASGALLLISLALNEKWPLSSK